MTPLRCAVIVVTALLYGIAPRASAASEPASQPVACPAHGQEKPCCAEHAHAKPCCAAHGQSRVECAAATEGTAPASAPSSQLACAHGQQPCPKCAHHAACAHAGAHGEKPCSVCARTRRSRGGIPWAVTRHPVTDTVSQGVDLALRPAHWVMATPLWWLEDQVYRDEGLRSRVQLHMEPPGGQ